jgi:hypothetical protein
MTTEDFIKHFGTKGMKWGVRKKSSSRKGKKGKKGRKVSDMSDEELKKKVGRLNMEKQYKTLTKNKRDQSLVRKGAKVAGEIIGKSAKKSLTSFSTKQMTAALEKAASKRTRRTMSVARGG